MNDFTHFSPTSYPPENIGKLTLFFLMFPNGTKIKQTTKVSYSSKLFELIFYQRFFQINFCLSNKLTYLLIYLLPDLLTCFIN